MKKRAVIVGNTSGDYSHHFKMGEVVTLSKEYPNPDATQRIYEFTAGNLSQTLLQDDFLWVSEEKPQDTSYEIHYTTASNYIGTPYLVEAEVITTKKETVAAFKTYEAAERYLKQLEEEQS